MCMGEPSAVCSFPHPHWFVIFIAERLKHDGDKASQHRQIGKQPLHSTLNFVILCHFHNEHTVRATAVKDGSYFFGQVAVLEEVE